MNIKNRSCHSFCCQGQCAEPLGESWSSCGFRWQLGHDRKGVLHVSVEQISSFAKNYEPLHQVPRSGKAGRTCVEEKEGWPQLCKVWAVRAASGERQLRRCRFGAKSEQHATCDILPTRSKPGMHCSQAYRVLLSGYLHIGVKGE